MMTMAEGALTLFLSILLVGAAVHKFMRRDRASTAVAGLLGLGSGAPAMAMAAACAELAIGVAMLLPETRTFAAVAAASLWGGYALLLDRVARSGRAVFDCGCSFFRRSSGSGDQRLIAATLALLAAAVALLPAHAALTILSVPAGLGFFALYVAVGELLSIRKITESPL